MSCRPLGCFAALALAACDSCPPDYHVITAMRVLGTVYDPPVASPKGVVTVRALVADVAERDVTVAWYRCPRPLQLTAVADLDGGLDASALVAPCLAQGEFARGLSVRVVIDAEGGATDAVPYRPARRWTDLVGFACAGGRIEAPAESGLWPRCTGARGVVFTASIPGPMRDGANPVPPPATIEALSFAQSPWSDATVPTVPRCEGSRETCDATEVTFRVSDTTRAVEVTGEGGGILGAPGDDIAFIGYHVTAAAPASTDTCFPSDPAAVLRAGEAGALTLRWVPPSSAGDVTFWFTARRYTGGLTVTRRTVRVQ